MGIAQEKADFWEKITTDGTLDKLKALADNEFVSAVNEAYDNKMMYYVGVLTNETLPDATRVIQFPKGTYVIVKAEAATSEELKDTLTGLAFRQALVEE